MATVFVGGINRKATPALLLKFFEDNFGSTSDCKIIMDRDTGSSKGYGFVTFKTEKAAKHVVSNGFVFFMGKRVWNQSIFAYRVLSRRRYIKKSLCGFVVAKR